jgi:hypothetical protein
VSDKHRQAQTDTHRHRQAHTGIDKHTQAHTGIDRHTQAHTGTHTRRTRVLHATRPRARRTYAAARSRAPVVSLAMLAPTAAHRHTGTLWLRHTMAEAHDG